MGFFSRLFSKRSNQRAEEPAQEMVSLVILLRMPIVLDVPTLRQELDAAFPGNFLPENEDSFVIQGPAPTQFMVQSVVPSHSGIFFVISIPAPYMEPGEAAAYTDDLQVHTLMAEHEAWLSVDLVSELGTEADAYRFIGKTLARVVPQGALAIIRPGRNCAVAFDAASKGHLQSEDVLAALGL